MLSCLLDLCGRRSESQDPEAEDGLEALFKIDGERFLLRKDTSVAKWDRATGMAKLVVRRGKMWNCTGITRTDLLCFVEETVFLVEHGFLVLLLDDEPLQLEQVYELLSISDYSCTWDEYQVYAYFKNLGYILQRHGICWSSKSKHNEAEKRLGTSVSCSLQPKFDVYKPNSRFKKTSPGLPCFSICISSSGPPRRQDIRSLQHQNGHIPVKFAMVDGGHVGIYSFQSVELPLLA